MQLRECGFTFGGVHTSAFGLMWAEKGGHALTADVSRNEYSIAGRDGTVLLDGTQRKTMPIAGTLYVTDGERTNGRETQLLGRQIAAWLTGGRLPLIFDYEPDVFYMAQVDKSLTLSVDRWFGGELPVTFVCQPYAYSLHPDTAETRAVDTLAVLDLDVHTHHPAPLEMLVENTGTARILGVDVLNGRIDLRGIDLQPGEQLRVSMEQPIGAVIGEMENALPWAVRFDLVELDAGMQRLPVVLDFDQDGQPGALIRAAARGRW